MRYRLCVLTTGWIVSILATVADATPIAVGSTLEVVAEVRSGTIENQDAGNDQWGVILSPLSVSAGASAPGALASASASASWDSVSEGIYSQTESGTLIGPVSGNAAESGNGWTYSFIADTDGVFELAYSIGSLTTMRFANGNTNTSHGAGSFRFTFNGVPATLSGNGTLSRSIVTGGAYTVNIRSSLGLIGGTVGDGNRTTVSQDGSFSWSFETAVVPEPQTFALLLIGLALLGAHARRL